MEIDTSDSEEDSEAGSRKVHLLQGASTRTNKNEVPRKEIDTSDSEIETSDSEVMMIDRETKMFILTKRTQLRIIVIG